MSHTISLALALALAPTTAPVIAAERATASQS